MKTSVFVGMSVDGFIAHCQAGLSRYERSMHFMGNLYIEVDGDKATSEAYTIAFHRLSATTSAKGDRPARDHLVQRAHGAPRSGAPSGRRSSPAG